MRKAAERLDQEVDFRTLTVACRPEASLVVAALRGSADIDPDRERDFAFAYIDVPPTGDGVRLPAGFYLLRTLVDPVSRAAQVAFVAERGEVATTIPAAIEVVGTGTPDPNGAANCDVDGAIEDGRACIVGKCCVLADSVCLEIDACITWGGGTPNEG